jgi:hypothetical protein
MHIALYTALNKLGYNSYHMVEAVLDSANDSLVHWNRAVRAKYYNEGQVCLDPEGFEKMLWRYDVCLPISALDCECFVVKDVLDC